MPWRMLKIHSMAPGLDSQLSASSGVALPAVSISTSVFQIIRL